MEHIIEYDEFVNEGFTSKEIGEKIFYLALAAVVGFLAKEAVVWIIGKIKGMGDKKKSDEILNKISKSNPEVTPILKTIQKMNPDDQKRFNEIMNKLNSDPMLNFLLLKVGQETDNFKKKDLVKKIEEKIKGKLNSDELELWNELSKTL